MLRCTTDTVVLLYTDILSQIAKIFERHEKSQETEVCFLKISVFIISEKMQENREDYAFENIKIRV